ncbi:MAG: right-handed parallel beta-helix repeat-containing protein [Candidatus Contendobacter sp.]
MIINRQRYAIQSILLPLFKILILFFLGQNLAIGRIILVPTEYSTIQAAVNIAISGDIIRIQPGIYNESVTILDKQKSGITLEGVDKKTTIINPNGSNRGISILITNNVTVRNLTVTKGNPKSSPYSPTIGGGIFVDGSNNIKAYSCIIANNNSENGAGFAARNSSITFSDNIIDSNKASSAKEARGGGAFFYESQGVISNNVFSGNSTSGPTMGPGGGLFIQRSSLFISDNTFSNNQATGTQNYGGGLYIYDSKNFTVSNNLFRNNIGLDGGGMAVVESNPTIAGNTFTGNEARWGGGLYGWHMSSVISSNKFEQNTANDGGGGILFDQSPNSTFRSNIVLQNSAMNWGGGVDLYGSPIIIFGNIIQENRSVNGGGIAITVDHEADTNEYSPKILHNTIKSNTAQAGGGIMLDGDTNAIIKNNIFAENKANSGGGLVIHKANSPQVINNTFYINQAMEIGGSAIRSDRSYSTLINNIFYGIPSAEAISANASTVQLLYNGFAYNKSHYVNIQSAFNPIVGNISSDPKFTAPSVGDFRLKSDSPYRNQGNPSFIYNNPDNSRNTIGAYGGPDTIVTYPIYRFYNMNAGGHFFTIDESEKDTVIRHYPWFRYEGVGFRTPPLSE